MVYSLEVSRLIDKLLLLKIKGEIILKYNKLLRDYFLLPKIRGNSINI